jgi:hypothetical protein
VLPEKELLMASIQDIKSNGYCNSIDKELSEIKQRVDTLRENLKNVYGPTSEFFRSNERHLADLADDIDHRQRLLMKDCFIDRDSKQEIDTDDSFMYWVE